MPRPPKILEPGFKITNQGKGYWITFENLCTVSVQMGYGNYCNSNQEDHYHRPADGVESPDAEVAAWDREGKWIHPKGFDFYGDDVIGYLSPDEVARFIQAVKDYPNAPAA